MLPPILYGTLRSHHIQGSRKRIAEPAFFRNDCSRSKTAFCRIPGGGIDDMIVSGSIFSNKIPLIGPEGHDRLITDFQNPQSAIGERVPQTETPWAAIRFSSDCLNITTKIQAVSTG